MEETEGHDPAGLLRRYAENGDEAAFAALVERFKGLVFSTALRRLGCAQLAEEATQTTFAIVARKARALQNVTHHAAWLHRTTTRVCRTLARTEARHRRKMDALIEHSDSDSGAEPDDWMALHPHLDEALESLPEHDRQLLMLRFFNELSFREIGERLGKTEAAAQRQGHRAVQKLAHRLRSKGIATASTALLAAGLATQLTSPAPAALATSALSQSAIAAAPTLGGGALVANTLYTMSQAKTLTITAAAVFVALVPLAIQRSAIAKEKSAITLLERGARAPGGSGAVASGGSASLSALPSKGGANAGGRELHREIDLADWLDELEAFMDGGDLDKVTRATEMLNSLKQRSRDELAALLAEAQTIQIANDQLRNFVAQVLCEKIALVHLDLALHAAIDLNLQVFSARSWIIGSTLASAAEVDAAAAVDAFFDADAAGQLPPPGSDGKLFRDPITSSFFSLLYEKHEGEADRFFEGLGSRDQRMALSSREKDLDDPGGRKRVFGYVRRVDDIDQRRWSLGVMAENYGRSNGIGERTSALVQEMGANGNLSPEHAANLVVAAAKTNLRGSQQSADRAFEWIAENSPPEFAERNLTKARQLREHYTEGGQ